MNDGRREKKKLMTEYYAAESAKIMAKLLAGRL